MKIGQRVGPFDIDKELGSGAMGTVYRAKYRKTGQYVAIKVMLAGAGGNKTALARFEREASVLKQFHHPNIVRFYAAGDYDGAPFYAMEYIQGEPLDRMLQRGGRLTWEKVVEIGKQVCAALKHAHDQGVVHRDLKPSNLMVLPDGTVKLTDFGIAKDLDVTQLTSANCTVGTAAYMSPEQCKGERDLTHKSDLYSFGIVLYELLVGQKPFQAETTMDMFLQHVQGTFERPSRIVLEIPVWLDNIVCQLLEKKPEHRPFDAGVVADALDKVAEKVAAQQSAGVERAKARLVDRSSRDKPIDETDRKAAATIRTGFSRARKKRRAKPFYQKVWFQLVAISTLLLVVAAILFQAFKAPSAESLYKQAKTAMNSGDFEAMKEARRGAIADYLSHYGQGVDERTVQVRGWADDVDVRMLEASLPNRRRLFQPKDDGEAIFRSALAHEEAGELDEAEKRWHDLEVYDDKECEDLRPYHILAQQRIRVVQEAKQTEKEFVRTARQISESEKAIELSDELERIATEALRYGQFKDTGMERVRWNELKMKTEKRSDKRPWTLIAYKRIKPFKEETFEETERGPIVKAKFEEAVALAGSRTKEARALFKEIVALYRADTDEELKKLAADAQKRYDDLVKAEGQ